MTDQALGPASEVRAAASWPSVGSLRRSGRPAAVGPSARSQINAASRAVILSSTLLTLLVLPVLYRLVHGRDRAADVQGIHDIARGASRVRGTARCARRDPKPADRAELESRVAQADHQRRLHQSRRAEGRSELRGRTCCCSQRRRCRLPCSFGVGLESQLQRVTPRAAPGGGDHIFRRNATPAPISGAPWLRPLEP